MIANSTATDILGRLVTTCDLSSPDIFYHDVLSCQTPESMETCMLEDSDEWLRNAVSMTDATTERTRAWIEMIVEKGDSIFLIVGYDKEAPGGVRLRKVLHKWLSSSDTDLNQISNPWWTSFKVYKCDGWLEEPDVIQVMLTDDLKGQWEDAK